MSNSRSINMIRNSKGLTVIEAAIAIAIVGIAALLSLQIGGIFNTKLRSSDRSRLTSYFHSDLMARSKRLLVSVQDNSTPPRHVRALCHSSLVRTTTQSAGVGLVQVNVNSTAANNVFSGARWDEHFSSDWSPVACPSDKVKGAYLARCFTLSESSSLRHAANSGDKILGVVKITPLGLDPALGSSSFAPLKNDTGWLDAKKVAYAINSSITIEGIVASSSGTSATTTEKQESNSSGMVWSAEVAYCDINNLKVAFSGSGLGDWQGNTVFNTTRYDESTMGPLMINVQKREIMAGEILNYNSADYMKARPDRNAEIACTEARFRCVDDTSARNFYPQMAFRTNIRYFATNNVNSRVQNTFALRPQIVREGLTTDLLASRRNDIAYLAAGQPFVEQNQHMYQLDTNGNVTTTEFFVGGALTRTVVDVTLNNSEPMCRTICQSPSTKYHLNFMATLWGYDRNGSDYVENIPNTSKAETPIQVGCKACYMKSCNRFGVEVFGPMSAQPPEPLDGVVPECASQDSGERSRQVYLPAQLSQKDANRCVSFKMNGSTPVLRLRDCSERLPVMCFAFGRFMPARELSKPGQFIFPEVAFGEAQRLCYEQGRENGLREDIVGMFRTNTVPNLAVELATLGRMIGSGKSAYDIVNVSNQGLFIAPQSARQWNQLVAGQTNPQAVYNDTRYPAIAGKEFWIALRTTSSGHPAPEIPVSQSKIVNRENYGIYWEPNGRPKVTEFRNPPLSDAVSSGTGVGVLLSHIKHRGLAFASPSSTVQRPVICRRSGSNSDFYVFRTATTSSNAAQVCRGSGGVFAAPTTPLGWAQAIRLLAQNASPNLDHPLYPFPQPTNATGTPLSPLAAWVALEADVSGNSASGWRIPANHFIFDLLGDTSLLTKAQKECDDYEAAYKRYLEQKEATKTGPGPTEPIPPSHICSVDTSGADERNWLGQYLPPTKSGRRANGHICEDNASGEWTKMSNSSNSACPGGSSLVGSSSLKTNYMNSTKWLMIQSQLQSSDILWIPR
jgi:hypothetical protein